MIIRSKQKIIAALTVSHGIYRKATFILNGQPVKIYFLTDEEYQAMIEDLTPERMHEWVGMLQKVKSTQPIYYCQWTVKATECHLITNKIQELVDSVMPGEVGTFEMDLNTIVVRNHRKGDMIRSRW
ncbi:hypothetical protein P4H71_28205 [Paenibacillus kribbensis]|uniref:hypothetical protein n=1 Tax=Paenibacillus kribbensis TaxID=172713 RepID=UPI002DBC64B0|nr:hypothetical protein [Paenibacillus kribbensis]MEC0238201.1 hypothetical protein [Paenibacillus kribbensis]